MLKRRWFAAVALGLTAGLGQAQEQTGSSNRSAQAEQQPAQALPIPLPVEIVEDEASAEARQRREAETAQREIEDLIAQKGMNAGTQAINEATQRMAFHSKVSTWLVGLGTILLLATLWLTRQANKAAHAAVSVTREVGEAQTRAYLHCNSASFRRTKEELVVTLSLSNTGQSPASDVVVEGSLIISQVGGHHKSPRVLSQATTESVPCLFSPIITGGKEAGQIWFFRDLDALPIEGASAESETTTGLSKFKDLFDIANHISFNGNVTWKDVFGERHSIDLDLSASLEAKTKDGVRRLKRTGSMDARTDEVKFRLGE